MVGSASKAAVIVRIDVEQGAAGLFYVTSPDLKGFLVAEPTFEAALAATPAAIVEMYAACDMEVFVAPVAAREGDGREFVAVPSFYARPSLSAA